MNPQSTTTCTCTCACTPSSGAQLWAQVYHHDDSSLFDIMPPSVDVAAVKDLVKRERVIAQMESPIDPCRMFVHCMMVDHNMRFIPSDLPRPPPATYDPAAAQKWEDKVLQRIRESDDDDDDSDEFDDG